MLSQGAILSIVKFILKAKELAEAYRKESNKKLKAHTFQIATQIRIISNN